MLASTSDLESAANFWGNLSNLEFLQLRDPETCGRNQFRDLGTDYASDDLEQQLLKLPLPSQRKAPEKISNLQKICSEAYSPPQWLARRKNGYRKYAEYLSKCILRSKAVNVVNEKGYIDVRYETLPAKEENTPPKRIWTDDTTPRPAHQLTQISAAVSSTPAPPTTDAEPKTVAAERKNDFMKVLVSGKQMCASTWEAHSHPEI